jgi:hypothetical protein
MLLAQTHNLCLGIIVIAEFCLLDAHLIQSKAIQQVPRELAARSFDVRPIVTMPLEDAFDPHLRQEGQTEDTDQKDENRGQNLTPAAIGRTTAKSGE